MKASRYTHTTLAVLLTAAGALAGCSSDKTRETHQHASSNRVNENSPDYATFSARQSPPEDPKTDSNAQAEILAMLTQINQHEIDAAQVAQRKRVGQDVADFAKMLQQSHTTQKEEVTALGQKMGITPKDTDQVDKVKKKQAKSLEKISMLEGNEFAREYLDAMVKGHNEALKMIDDDMMPKATDAALKDHLSQMRKVVSEHLDKAKSLREAVPKD